MVRDPYVQKTFKATFYCHCFNKDDMDTHELWKSRTNNNINKIA